MKIGKVKISFDPLAIALIPLLVLTVRYRLVSYYFLSLEGIQFWYATAGMSIAVIASVILHEVFHVIVAQARGVRIRGISFFIFGAGDPIENAPNTKSERIAETLGGFFLGGIFTVSLFALSYFLDYPMLWPLASQMVFHLALLNLGLWVLQLLPLLPLDGGRLILERARRDSEGGRRFVQVLFQIGNFVALVLVVAGLFVISREFPFFGAWLILVGVSLLRANVAEYSFLKGI